MRIVASSPLVPLLCVLCLCLAPEPAAARSGTSAFSSPDALMTWESDYHAHPQPWRLPEAVRAMKNFGLLDDDEKGGFCTGFIAGVLGSNPKDGPALVRGLFPMPPKQQAVIIKAIAYSGRPDWQDLLTKFASRMPLRKPLIDAYLDGKAPLLLDASLDQGGTPLLYTLWGYYAATGDYQPVLRVMQALRWSKSPERAGFSWAKLVKGWTAASYDVDKVTVGGTAKWTLASYAEQHRELLTFYRAELNHQPPDIAGPLADVIDAAQNFDSEKIRKDQLGAIQDAERKKESADMGMSKLATAGSIGIATGCIAAGVLGQSEVAVPCVIGGALYTGAVKLMH
jgi:hypothetical protein